MAVSGMSLLWLQPMSTIVTGGREGALACESCVSFVTFLALSSCCLVNVRSHKLWDLTFSCCSSDHRDVRRIAGLRAPLQCIVAHQHKHQGRIAQYNDHC